MMGVETAALLWRTVPPIILVVGICGNILTILVLTRPASRKSSTAVYLIALAIADTVVLNTGLLRYWIFLCGLRHTDVVMVSGSGHA
ncbi:hypothetical protein MAR_017670 [Mya arenaria]|uniref:G-protein coupled receptors family 1 profile domain-containing protein n=1 Tax=Mya arenaria TaxID=6604 RepID=A0ABY7EFL4_MYAAR|nr:hypothetical protein MAR_017670 [Mya arenaria]